MYNNIYSRFLHSKNVNCVFVCDSDLYLFVYIHLYSTTSYLFHCIYYDSFYIQWIVILYMDFIGMQIN
jgi:CTP:phosphocholine cytidylyltransferase-like protein